VNNGMYILMQSKHLRPGFQKRNMLSGNLLLILRKNIHRPVFYLITELCLG